MAYEESGKPLWRQEVFELFTISVDNFVDSIGTAPLTTLPVRDFFTLPKNEADKMFIKINELFVVLGFVPLAAVPSREIWLSVHKSTKPVTFFPNLSVTG